MKKDPSKQKLKKLGHPQAAHRHPAETSWERAHEWYDKIVGQTGHYYHENIILPNFLRLCAFEKTKKPASLLDLACGQGVISRHLPPGVSYLGIDAAPSLIKAAKKYQNAPTHTFLEKDVTHPLKLDKREFTHASIILALQNIKDPFKVIQNAHQHLQSQGQLIIVLNHPCFRIPRQSSWGVDPEKHLQFRRVDRYFSALEIPILTHPSQKELSSKTFSYHYPLSSYSKWLQEAGFVMESIEEWCSDKKSVGKTARMENRSRQEFPLFLAFSARKA